MEEPILVNTKWIMERTGLKRTSIYEIRKDPRFPSLAFGLRGWWHRKDIENYFEMARRENVLR
jgi:predicted DNA-binding transcriptional regulator AlpA